MKPKYPLSEVIKVKILIFIFNLLLKLSMSLKIKLAAFIESITFFMIKFSLLPSMRRRYAIALTNLELCFPHKSYHTHMLLVRACFRESILTYLNYGYMFTATKGKVKQDIKCKKFSKIANFEEVNTIVMVPHFCAFDLGMNRTSMDTKFCSIYKHVDSYFFERLRLARLRFVSDQNSRIFPSESAIKKVVSAMVKDHLLLYYLPDLDHGINNSCFIPFLAQPSCAILKVLPKLAQITNAQIVPSICYRVKNNYVVEFFEPINNLMSGDEKQDVKIISDSIARTIKKHPSQYRWYYLIFNTQPNLPDGFLYRDIDHKLFKRGL